MTVAGTSLRVLLAEDNLLARLGVRGLLATQADIEVVGEAEDGVVALQRVRELRPDVVVADLRMPHMDGVQLAAALAREVPHPGVLVLSQLEGDEHVIHALAAGALGYVTKDAAASDILNGVRAVARGERFLPAALAARMAARVFTTPLTARELAVLAEMAKGRSNKEIARALGLTSRTATMYVSNVLSKLGAETRTEAVVMALQKGLISLW